MPIETDCNSVYGIQGYHSLKHGLVSPSEINDILTRFGQYESALPSLKTPPPPPVAPAGEPFREINNKIRILTTTMRSVLGRRVQFGQPNSPTF